MSSVAGALLLLLGALAASCYDPSWAKSVVHVGRDVYAPLPTPLAGSGIPRVELTEEQLATYNATGYLLLRQALPAQVVHVLLDSAKRAYPQRRRAFWNENGPWALKGHNAWMDVDAFADFVLHRSSAVGALAAQLLGARRVRFSGECLNGVTAEHQGSNWHIDFPWNFSHAPRSMPLIRLFLPLHAIDANETGGSLSVAPLEHAAAQWDEDALARVQESAHTPDFAPGDLLLYSPVLPHRTQPVLHGERIAYLATFYDADRLLPYLHSQPEIYDPLGLEGSELARILFRNPFGLNPVNGFGSAECWDASQREFHYNHWWTSAFTPLASDGATACYPQVFPEPLEHEVRARSLGQVHNTKGPSRTNADWLCSCFPVLRKAAMAAWVILWKLR